METSSSAYLECSVMGVPLQVAHSLTFETDWSSENNDRLHFVSSSPYCSLCVGPMPSGFGSSEKQSVPLLGCLPFTTYRGGHSPWGGNCERHSLLVWPVNVIGVFWAEPPTQVWEEQQQVDGQLNTAAVWHDVPHLVISCCPFSCGHLLRWTSLISRFWWLVDIKAFSFSCRPETHFWIKECRDEVRHGDSSL